MERERALTILTFIGEQHNINSIELTDIEEEFGEVEIAEAIGEAIRFLKGPKKTISLKVWTLASDTNNGTCAEVFTTEREANIARIEAIFHDNDEKREAAIFEYDAGDEDALDEMIEQWLRGSLDTFSVEQHTITVDVPSEHLKDSDCTVDPATNLCTSCGVLHGDPCPDCGGRGHHTDACPTLTFEELIGVGSGTRNEAEERTNARGGSDDGQEAERLLDKARDAQTAYWDALKELETELGIDIDAPHDLSGITVDDLIALNKEDQAEEAASS